MPLRPSRRLALETLEPRDVPAAPTIVGSFSGGGYLDVPAAGPAFVSGVADDPTDPAFTFGLNFTVNDAQALVSFAGENHLGRISMWSVNRDSQCGSSYSETGMLSDTCSGTAQSGLEFSQIFGKLQGNALATSGAGNVKPAVADTNPADAPFGKAIGLRR